MRNARPDEAQAGIKIPRRDINNLRYEDDTTLMVAPWKRKWLPTPIFLPGKSHG